MFKNFNKRAPEAEANVIALKPEVAAFRPEDDLSQEDRDLIKLQRGDDTLDRPGLVNETVHATHDQGLASHMDRVVTIKDRKLVPGLLEVSTV